MDYIGLLARWIHVLPAVILAGGVFFMRFCLHNSKDDSTYFDRHETSRKKWAMIVGITSGLLLLSGSYNFYSKLIEFKLGPVYHGLFTLKLLLGLVVFYLAALLGGRSDKARRFRAQEKRWLNMLCGILVAIILIGGYMKAIAATAPKKEIPQKNASTEADDAKAAKAPSPIG